MALQHELQLILFFPQLPLSLQFFILFEGHEQSFIQYEEQSQFFQQFSQFKHILVLKLKLEQFFPL